MKITFEEQGFADYLYWRDVNLKILDRINGLIQSIARDGAMSGIGKPEKLKRRNGVYSRRIDDANRLVYKYSPSVVTIVACKGHYE